jgi:AcrR family transcriptional regulator
LNSKEKILQVAKTLFATKGFANVSMRCLAKEAEISAATIYHHFPDKNTLYLDMMHATFAGKAAAFSIVWDSSVSAEKKLTLFIHSLIQEMTADPEFHRLMMREVVDANPERMKILADDIFKQQFTFLLHLMKDIAPKKNSYLSAVSVLSLCKHHIELKPLRQYLPDWKPEHEHPDVLAKHVLEILSNGL